MSVILRPMTPFKLFLCIPALTALCACADYQFKVNERVVYEPAPLFSGYDIGDAALRDCVAQHIADARITAAAQLEELNCAHAGIADLTGLEIFTGLERLKLSNNAITDAGPLAPLARLNQVYLDGNQLRSIMPLRGLEQLGHLDLQNNPALLCMQLEYFSRQPQLTLESPAHCRA